MRIKKGMAIRLVVYPLAIGIVGWQACSRFNRQKQAEADAKEQQEREREDKRKKLDAKSRLFRGPDGKSVKYYELTPEEFEEHFGRPPPAEGETEVKLDDGKPRVREELLPPEPNMR